MGYVEHNGIWETFEDVQKQINALREENRKLKERLDYLEGYVRIHPVFGEGDRPDEGVDYHAGPWWRP